MANGKLNQVMQQLRGLLGGPPSAGTDRELLDRFARTRDEAAFASLVERHGPMVLSVCRRIGADSHEADDAFQATFLVLAQKAAAIRWHESVAGWLQAVACRIASKQRANRARRQSRERQVEEMTGIPADDPRVGPRVNELQPVLDEELERLPEKYRTPLVLCYLEGKSGVEAARELGCSEAGVWTRLSRGRELLRARLARRGLALSATALAAGISGQAVAAPTTALSQATVQAALRLAAGVSAERVASTPIILLMKGALHTMWIARVKMASLWLVALAAIGLGLGLWWPRDLGVPDNGLVAVPVPIDSAPDKRPALPENVDLLTTYQDAPLAGAARQVTLKGKLGGNAELTIDVNQRTKVNGKFMYTQVAIKSRDVQLKELKMPDKAGRRLFEIVGANVPRWQLVTPGFLRGSYRLVQLDDKGNPDRIVTLEPRGAAALKEGPEVFFRSAYLPTKFAGAHTIELHGQLGGDGEVSLDGNACTLRDFGDLDACTKVGYPAPQVRLRKLDDETYELLGVPQSLRLILPGKQTSTGRLQLIDTDNLVEREISLENDLSVQLRLRSVYLDTPIRTGHRFTLEGRLGGTGVLTIEEWVRRKLRPGDASDAAVPKQTQHSVKLVKLNYEDRGRLLYKLEGVPFDLRLVVPAGPAGAFRLVYMVNDKAERVVTLASDFDTPAAGETVSLQSAYQAPAFAGGHVVSLTGQLGGAAQLTLDGNGCNLNLFGDTSRCDQARYAPIAVKLVKDGAGRYDVVGLQNHLMRLVLADKTGLTPRLELFDNTGWVEQEILLERK